MRNMQGSPQTSGTSTTSKGPIDCRLVDAEKEILRLKAAIEEANATIEDRKRELRKTQGTLCELDTSLTCEICTYRMERPVALACGHAYCSDCIKQWFQHALSAYKGVHGYGPNDLVSPQMQSAIRDLSLPLSMRQRIFADIDILIAQCPQPKYTCPKCRRRINRKPTLIFALQHLSATMATSQDGQPDSEARDFDATFWDDFFPIDVRDLADI